MEVGCEVCADLLYPVTDPPPLSDPRPRLPQAPEGRLFGLSVSEVEKWSSFSPLHLILLLPLSRVRNSGNHFQRALT